MMKDKLVVERQGKAYTMTREITEQIASKDFDKRIQELNTSEKQIINEIEKAQQAVVNMDKELERIRRNKAILEQAKAEGKASYEI